MNLLCPNCQKMLTVPEQYAGQLMKCPLCSGTFTVPALPQPAFGDAPPAAAPTPPPPPPGDVFSLKPHDAPAPAFQTAPPMELHDPHPAPPPPPPPSPSRPAPVPAPALPPEGYSKTMAICFSPGVLQWVPAACMLLVFVFLFFPWLGIYPGGVTYINQSAWGAAFGATPEDDRDLRKKREFKMINEEEIKANKDRDEKSRMKDYRPSISVLALFYVLLFVPFMLITIALAVLPLLKINLPPAVAQFLPWRFGIVAAFNALLLLFLGLQLVLNFSLENNFKDYVNNVPELKTEGKDTAETKEIEVRRGTALDALERTIWLRLTVFLHVVAIVAAALVFWINKRGDHKPVPKLELMW